MSPEQEIEARETQLFASRVRGGLLVWVAAAAVFIVADAVLGTQTAPEIEVARLSNVIALAAYLYLWRPRARWKLEWVTVLVMLQGISVLSLCVAILPDPSAALILYCVMVIGAATVLPWRFGCQVVVSTASVIGLGSAVAWSSSDGLRLFSPSMLGVFISFAVSLYIARVLELQRQATNRAVATIQSEARVSNSLARVGRELIHSLDEPALLQRLCALTTEVFECASSYTFLVDKDDRIGVVAGHGCASDEWGALTGSPFQRAALEPLMGQLRSAGFAHVDLEHRREWRVLRTVQQRDPLTLGICFALRKGNDLVGFQLAAFRGRQGSPTFYEGRLARGLSDLASLALETARLVEELGNANRVQSDFLANMSHELRTPLNVIIGYCEMLADGAFGEVNDEQEATVGHVRSAAEGQLALISATLQLSGMDSGDHSLETYEVDASAFLEELRRESELVVRGGHLDFRWRADSEVETFCTDAVKLKMVLKNLIDNAVKFTSEGHVSLAVEICESGGRFVIEDTGPGIPDDAREAIFGAFRQHTTPETQGRGGVGIGLYIVKRLVDALGGAVELDSELGRGTRFEVWVPSLTGEGSAAYRQSA